MNGGAATPFFSVYPSPLLCGVFVITCLSGVGCSKWLVGCCQDKAAAGGAGRGRRRAGAGDRDEGEGGHARAAGGRTGAREREGRGGGKPKQHTSRHLFVGCAVRLFPALLVLAVVGASESEPWGCSSSTTAIQGREVEGRGRTSRRVGARQQRCARVPAMASLMCRSG